MRLIRTTALTGALMTATISSLTSPAHAGDWNWGGWGWGGVAVGLATDGTGFGYAPNAYAPPYDHAYGTRYGYPAYSYDYGTSYSTPVYGGYRYAAYHPVTRHHAYAIAHGARRNWQ